MAEAAPEIHDAQEIGENAGLISISAIGRHSLGRDLRLKAEDVITAIDGEPITYDVDKFDSLLRDYKDLPALLTIFRDGKLLDVFANGPLGCSYKYADEPTIMAVNSAMQDRENKPKDSYYQYEALRNIHREVRLYSTRYEPMATILPAFWLLYRRMWEPLGVVGLITPWNYPLLMATWKVAPALAAGCSIILKPSQLASVTCLLLGEIAQKAGLPVCGRGARARGGGASTTGPQSLTARTRALCPSQRD